MHHWLGDGHPCLAHGLGKKTVTIYDITKMELQIKHTTCFSCLCFNIVLLEQLHLKKLLTEYRSK